LKKRFVFLDPSIKRDVGGHYLQYANQVLDEAVNCGHEALLVVNYDSPKAKIETNHHILGWFNRDFF
jgi:hypothetical protein